MSTKPRSESLTGLLRIALAATTWGTIPVFVRMVHTSAVVIVFWRAVLAALVAVAVLAFRRQFGALRTLPARRTAAVLGVGCLLGINWVLYLGALQLTKVAVAVLLAYCGPVFVAALTPALTRERFDKRLLLPLALALTGIIAIVGPQELSLSSGRELLGAGMALASALTYAGLVLSSKRLLTGVPVAAYMLGEYAGAAALLLPVVLFLPGPAHAQEWAGLAALGILDTAVTGLLFLSGLRMVRADHGAMLTYAEPVSAVIFSALLLGESVSLATVAGSALVITGGVLVARMRPQPSIEAAGLAPDETS
ncbi:MAG: DMT family transporter [Coriobacteriales bacterium]|nr:DMT family transporter [Actinomycetes bacterium]